MNGGAGSPCRQHDRTGAHAHACARCTKQSRVRAHACVSGVSNGVRRDHAVEQAARLATLPTSSTAPCRRGEFLCAATKRHRQARRRINSSPRRCWRAAHAPCRGRRARVLRLAQADAERYIGHCHGIPQRLRDAVLIVTVSEALAFLGTIASHTTSSHKHVLPVAASEAFFSLAISASFDTFSASE